MSVFDSARKLPAIPFELKEIWKDAASKAKADGSEKAPERKFVLRPLTIDESATALSKAETFIKAKGLDKSQDQESIDTRANIRACFNLFLASKLLVENSGKTVEVQLMESPEEMMKVLTFDELEKLAAFYDEVKRLQCPWHLADVTTEQLKNIVVSIRANPRGLQKELLGWKRPELTELLIRLVLESEFVFAPESEEQE